MGNQKLNAARACRVEFPEKETESSAPPPKQSLGGNILFCPFGWKQDPETPGRCTVRRQQSINTMITVYPSMYLLRCDLAVLASGFIPVPARSWPSISSHSILTLLRN
eukprot:GHVU01007362.1.p3 GENE.GHVU01007362.1~~GHVU01007362.1.p3  ORF type:complete len:108 (+),score=6.77 GHVU01007362.1:501-824(+)